MKIDAEKLREWLEDEITYSVANRDVSAKNNKFKEALEFDAAADAFLSMIDIINDPASSSADWWCEE